MRPILLIIISLLFFVGGEYYSKLWANTGNWKFIFLIILFYIIGVCFGYLLLKNIIT